MLITFRSSELRVKLDEGKSQDGFQPRRNIKDWTRKKLNTEDKALIGLLWSALRLSQRFSMGLRAEGRTGHTIVRFYFGKRLTRMVPSGLYLSTNTDELEYTNAAIGSMNIACWRKTSAQVMLLSRSLRESLWETGAGCGDWGGLRAWQLKEGIGGRVFTALELKWLS